MSAQPQPEEFCPRCGHWVTSLGDVTGWCPACSGEEVEGGQVCRRCHKPRPLDHYRPDSGQGKVCRACRTAVRRAWRHAHLEETRQYDALRKAGYRRTVEYVKFGRGRCPVCGRSHRLLADGTMRIHQATSGKWVAGGERCGGYGQAPVTP